MKFTKWKFEQEYNRIRNKIRKLPRDELIYHLMNLLHSADLSNKEQLVRYPPWQTALLLKWSVLHAGYPSSPRRDLSSYRVNELFNDLRDLEDNAGLPGSSSGGHLLFLRSLAYQQFWWQDEKLRPSLIRPLLLFGELPENHWLETKFYNRTGVGIRDWICLAYMLLGSFNSGRRDSVDLGYFRSVFHKWPEKVVESFLSSVSMEPGELKGFMNEFIDPGDPKPMELRERTPLIHCPLLKIGDQYYSYHQVILNQAITNFVYRLLREESPEAFGNRFGPVFESYIRRVLNESGVAFKDEGHIKEEIGGEGKLVDYLIESEKGNVLVDAKGVELARDAMTHHAPVVVTGKTKSSIIKGMKQGVETASRKQKANNDGGWSAGRNYLVLVTYERVFLGTGEDFYQMGDSERIEKAIQDPEGRCPIPLSNMFFVSIDEFEQLMNIVATTHEDLAGILEGIVLRQADREYRRFLFSQHLSELYEGMGAPEFLINEMDILLEDFGEVLGQQMKSR